MRTCLYLFCLATIVSCSVWAAEPPKLPQGLPDWKVEVIARPPELKYPSVCCMTPDGRILVAEDPMDMVRTDNTPVDRILCIHPDGKINVFAEGLFAVFGLQYIDGKVYVHHCPKFSVFKDDNSVGKGRVDLIDTTNPSPGAGGTFNDHIPSNIRLAMDGYIYMSVGDKGIFKCVSNVDKRTAEIRGGGVLRIRPVGTDMEVYCTGTRNHLDVAINAEDEIFTYDNTDDGNGWWTRYTHMVDGGYYGYPYEYRPHPSDLAAVARFRAGKGVKPWYPYTLWRIEEYAGGAPTGAVGYNEDALPEEYRGNTFNCEWGKKQMERFVVEREGASYKIVKREAFLTAGKGGELRPVGVAVQADGMGILVCDWNYDGWKVKSGEYGRLIKVTYTGPSKAAPKPAWFIPAATGQKFNATTAELIDGLKHPAQSVRLVAQRRLADKGTEVIEALVDVLKDEHAPPHARWHAIWTLDTIQNGAAGRDAILALAVNDASPLSVRMQAVRQLGTRAVKEAAAPLAHLLDHSDAAMRFRAATALGRIGDPSSIDPLINHLAETDFFAHFAMFTALNRIGLANPSAWEPLSKYLCSEKTGVRDGCVYAMRNVYDENLVKALIAIFAQKDCSAEGRAAAIRALAPLCRKTKPWDGKWWGTQPAKGFAPQRDVEWAGTPLVSKVLKEGLKDPNDNVRMAALDALVIAPDPSVAADLAEMFKAEKDVERSRAILHAIAFCKPDAASSFIVSLLNPDGNKGLLGDALNVARQINMPEINAAIIKLADADISKELLLLALESLEKIHDPSSVGVLGKRLIHKESEVVELASSALGNIKTNESAEALIAALKDKLGYVRRAAAKGLEKLRNPISIEPLIACAKDKEAQREVTEALTNMPDIRALDVYLDGLGGRNAGTRDRCKRAIDAIRDKALPIIEARLDTNPLPAAAIDELQNIYKPHLKTGEDGGKLFKFDTKALAPEAFANFAMGHKGIFESGRKLFFAESGVGCYKCHKINGEGAEIGPDLSSIGMKYDREKLIESVLYPSKVILDGFQQSIIKMTDGQVLSGLIRGETETELTLIDSNTQKTEVKKANVKARKISEISLMPEGLHKSLTPEEFSDLISFLEQQKEKPPEKKK